MVSQIITIRRQKLLSRFPLTVTVGLVILTPLIPFLLNRLVKFMFVAGPFVLVRLLFKFINLAWRVVTLFTLLRQTVKVMLPSRRKVLIQIMVWLLPFLTRGPFHIIEGFLPFLTLTLLTLQN